MVSRSSGSFAWSHDHDQLVGDIFGDLFLYAGSYRYQGGPAFRNWLAVLVKNRIRKALRGFKNRPRSLSEQAVPRGDRGINDPHELLVAREERRRLWQCWCLLLHACQSGLAEISREEKTVLRLHEYRGVTYRQIAERSGRPLQKVVSISRRGRRKVSRRMALLFSRAIAAQALSSDWSARNGLDEHSEAIPTQ